MRRFEMKKRLLIAGCIIAIGLILIASSITASILRDTLPLGSSLLVGIGVLLLIVGLLLLISEIFESLLTRGQTMLVDGLQAG
ncbi:hypothetical protein A3K71_06010 [archaeon RBG_16_50_20]|nr:MAG: hypothetical protein A3K71_06010 [archaeon RBG_16_50_20]